MTRLLRRLIPSSLAGQIVGVAAIALLLAQAINLLFLVRAGQRQAEAQASALVVARMAGLVDRPGRIERLAEREPRPGLRPPPPPERRPRLGLSVGARPVAAPGFVPRPDLADRLSGILADLGVQSRAVQVSTGPRATLPAELGRDPRRPRMREFRRLARDREAATDMLLLEVHLPSGRWVAAAAPLNLRDRMMLGWLLVQTLILYAAVLVPLALIARRIARPLRALTTSVEGFDGSAPFSPVAASGPQDVQRLVAAYSGMAGRVDGLIGEKDVMLGAIGHDLKTPLAALRIRIECVEDDAEREKMADGIAEMVTILDDILVLARMGRSGEPMQRTDLVALTETIADELIDGGADVTVDRPVAAIEAALRPVLIRRALRNLIGNAVKYGARARIGFQASADSVAVLIDDDGPGIAAPDVERLFEPFARAEGSRNRATGGSGLGLTIARAIARAHGGDVTLANRPDGGLRATLTLARR